MSDRSSRAGSISSRCRLVVAALGLACRRRSAKRRCWVKQCAFRGRNSKIAGGEPPVVNDRNGRVTGEAAWQRAAVERGAD